MIGVLGFDSWWWLGIFLFATASRTALGPNQPPIQWVLGDLLPWCKADHSPPYSANVKDSTSESEQISTEWHKTFVYLTNAFILGTGAPTLQISYINCLLGLP
jgi:hypothetical protein